MSDIVAIDDVWGGETTAVLSRWLYRDGDLVEAGSTLCEIMVEKVSIEIAAPASGVLHILVAEETIIASGTKLGSVS
jgi:pyruvate/2-oxoglutarate dehydrogenase complex dihydrolipoamide acyltransferase (E2) component